jgi:hypothetical protein
MKLYHAEPLENKNNILENGIDVAIIITKNNGLESFETIDGAIDHANKQQWDGAAIFSYESKKLIVDQEFNAFLDNGIAYYIPTLEMVLPSIDKQKLDF